MLDSSTCEEELELGEGSSETPKSKTYLWSNNERREHLAGSSHPFGESRVLRYAPSRCRHSFSFESPHSGHQQPPLVFMDCKLINSYRLTALYSASTKLR